MAAIDDRYDALKSMPERKVKQIAGKITLTKGRAIVVILQREFSVSDYNTWAPSHGQSLLPT